jgi:hypothetical protein
MTPLHFDSGAHRLYGVLHGASADVGVVLIGPLGQEAVRVHRMLRVLAERLARQSVAVLRFDPFGSGDSDGADEELSLATWSRDIAAADAQLRRSAGCGTTVWLGVRLGGTAAMLGTAFSSPKALLLWEPVVDGAAYLQSLAADHVRALRYSFGPTAPRSAGDSLPNRLNEALGFGLGAGLCAELVRISPAALAAPPCRCTVVAPAVHAVAPWLASQGTAQGGGQRRFVAFEHQFDWTSEEALNTALVPADAVRVLVAELEALR